MAKKRKGRGVKTVTIARVSLRTELVQTNEGCYLFCSFMSMTCPLCRATVPKGTEHRCGKPV